MSSAKASQDGWWTRSARGLEELGLLSFSITSGPVHTDIAGGGGMCQGPNRNYVHPAFGHRSEVFQNNTAGGLDQCSAVDDLYRLTHGGRAHVIEHDDQANQGTDHAEGRGGGGHHAQNIRLDRVALESGFT